jgi:hypothetical protein
MRGGPAPTATLATLRIIWRVLLGSLAVYSMLPWFIQPEGGATVDTLLLGLTAIAALTAIGTLVARERLLMGPIRSGELRVTTNEGMARLTQISISLWAFSESIGLYGLILYVLSGEAKYLYLFLMASAGLFYAHRPGRLPTSDYTSSR